MLRQRKQNRRERSGWRRRTAAGSVIVPLVAAIMSLSSVSSRTMGAVTTAGAAAFGRSMVQRSSRMSSTSRTMTMTTRSTTFLAFANRRPESRTNPSTSTFVPWKQPTYKPSCLFRRSHASLSLSASSFAATTTTQLLQAQRYPSTLSLAAQPNNLESSDDAGGTENVIAAVNNGIGTPPTSFDDGQRPFQITTPIYYVNDKPHIGHAYTSTACDVIARFMRLSGRNVCFVSGTDEHGQKVEQSAATRNVPPQQFVDTVSMQFRELLELLHISNDVFIHTTDKSHKRAVQHIWTVLVEKGYIYKGTYEGWYCIRDECFYAASELVDGKAPTGADVEWVAKEESYFFKLSAFEDKLLQLYETTDFIAPDGRRNEVLSFVRGGLRDLSISRTSFTWGVPVPDDPDHVVYVWIDALTNYLSAIGYPGHEGDNKEASDDRFATFWPCALHVVGKDILRFHAVYWPAMLMAADLPLPKRVFAHGWWTKDGQKISKSLGNVIDPVELVDKYGVDQTRFFLMAEVNFGNDGDFSDKAMILKVNSNLANELGNLCQRTLSMVYKNCQAAVPEVVGPYTEYDEQMLESARTLRHRAAVGIATQAIHKYVDVMVQQIVDTNKYIDEMAPWALKKTDPARMATVLYVIMEVLRHAAILYQPLIPTSANKILDQLSVPANERSFAHLDDAYRIKPGAPIQQPEGVFPRLELPVDELVQTG